MLTVAMDNQARASQLVTDLIIVTAQRNAAAQSGPTGLRRRSRKYLRDQPLFLTRKITGSVKFKPSSATIGGGAGTGSARWTMASAASSNALSPDPLAML